MDYGLGELQQYQRHGLNVCDENGQCDDDRFDCLDESCNNGNCVAGRCPGDDEPYGSFYESDRENDEDEDDDEHVLNCSREPCSDTEKEDSWLDDETEYGEQEEYNYSDSEDNDEEYEYEEGEEGGNQ